MGENQATQQSAPLWSGRFSDTPTGELELFGASLGFDQRLWPQDIQGSIAHATMLGRQGILSAEDVDAIVGGLRGIAADAAAGAIAFDPSVDEDVHMCVERVLTERIGEAGGRLHTARSRNDQSVTDSRLFAKEQAATLYEATLDLCQAILSVSREQGDAVMPGYTHLQPAQPVLFSHHLMAYFWMFLRDTGRFKAAWEAADASPLGAAALAGTTYPIDRRYSADLLGFSHVIPNTMDAVSNRDFIIDLVYACAVCQMHLSRLCEELVDWSSAEVAFVEMDDSHATGSSIMPQKKNPDFGELVRGKTGRVYGDLVAILTVMKGLPMTYDKDLQEDKEPMFDAVDTVTGSLHALRGMVSTMTVKADRMRECAHEGYMAATDLADYLVGKGMPFRQAHGVAGRTVAYCVQAGVKLQELTLDELRAQCDLFDEDVFDWVDIDNVVARRDTYGGTGHEAVAAQMDLAAEKLAAARGALG